MKFENLSLLKQTALIVDIAQLHTHLNIYNVDKVGDPILEGTGLSLPINHVRLANAVYVELPKEVGNVGRPERIVFSYPKDDRSHIGVAVQVGNGEEVAEDVQLDRFGITANMLFSGDLEESFARGAKFVKSVEKLTGEDYGISKTLKTLAKAAKKAKELPEELLDHYYVNHALSVKLGYIAKEVGQFDYELTGNHDVNPLLDKPDYNTTALFNGRTVTYHVASEGSPTHYTLVIDFGYGGDDVINIGYRIGSEDFVLISRIPVVNHSDPHLFTDKIRASLIDAIHNSDKRDYLETKTSHFIEVYDKAVPNIHKSIESSDVSDVYRSKL